MNDNHYEGENQLNPEDLPEKGVAPDMEAAASSEEDAPLPPVETPSPTPAPAPSHGVKLAAPQHSNVQNALDVMKSQPSNVDAQLTEDAKAQKAFFEKQPKVIMNIPLREGEKAGQAYETVQVNGYRLQILKGRSVSLPAGVAEILANHYNIQLGTGGIPEEAGYLADRDNASAQALS